MVYSLLWGMQDVYIINRSVTLSKEGGFLDWGVWRLLLSWEGMRFEGALIGRFKEP